MRESFDNMLAADGKKNSLGRVNEVIEQVLLDHSKINELFASMLHKDAWVRMRAADAFEKVCRQHPEWVLPFIDRIQIELSESTQASIQWHIAQIYTQVTLDNHQKKHAINWLVNRLSSVDTDWIVAANSMTTLAFFTEKGDFKKSDLQTLLQKQLKHKSSAVVRRALKLIATFS